MTIRKNDFYSIKDLMETVVTENNLEKGLQKISVEEVWYIVMGAGVKSYTKSVLLQNKTLIVSLTSSVLREELSYGKEKIISMLNEALKNKLIDKIMLV